MLRFILCDIFIPMIIGCVFGIIIANKKTYGEILVDDENEQCMVRMNSLDLLNPKIKRIEFKVIHDITFSQEKQSL